MLIHDLSFLNEDEQQAIKDLERQLVDIVTDLLVRLDAEGRIVRRTKKIYTMILFGIINYTYTWYDPEGRDRSAGIRRYGGRIVPAWVCAGCGCQACHGEPAREALD